MSETKNDFLNELKEEFKEFGSKMSKMFEDLTGKGEGTGGYEFKVDIYETGENYVFLADIPGITKEEVKVQIQDNNLVINGERKKPGQLGEQSWHKQERMFGAFKRSFSLPPGVNSEGIKAKFDNGVLTITLSKSEVTKSGTEISID